MDVVYTTASTNRYFQAANVSPEGLVAFGAGNLLALWNTEVCIFILSCYALAN